MDLNTAWAIGLFEGEGCISIQNTKSRGYSYLRCTLQLASTDEDVVRRFHDVVGRGNVNGPYKRSDAHKQHWVWQAAARGDVIALLVEWIPLLGTRRKKRAIDALERIT